jgi:hypothetical protein
MDDDFLITVEHWHHVRTLQGRTWCTRGARIWAESNGLDFDKFVREGLPASAFINTNDAIAMEFVKAAREARNG